MAKTFNLNDYLKPQEQWAMSAADNVYGLSLPEYIYDRPEDTPPVTPVFSAEDPDFDDIQDFIADILAGTGAQPSSGYRPASANEYAYIPKDLPERKIQAQKQLFEGAVLKTIGASSDFFSRLTGILSGQPGNIRKSAEIAAANYDNQMAALDNQVLYLKNRMMDRFNKTVETNIMNMAARNIRVTSGGVLDMTKEEATEISEDMRMADSNARLKKIAMEAGKKSAKESSKYAIKQMWAGMVGSAAKLGMMVGTGGGTGESWGNLWSGYKNATKLESAIDKQSFNEIY